MSQSNNLVLFDIDGTLIRRAGPHHKLSLIEGIRRVTGITTTLDGVATHGMLDRDLIVLMLRAAGRSERQIQRAMPKIISECRCAYLSHCANDLRQNVCDGVVDLLAQLQQRGAVIGLVTGNLREIGWKKMELAGLRDCFSVGAFSEDGKTRARLAKVAAQRAIKQGLVQRTSHVAVIGDHPNDVLAAKANNFLSVAVATGLATLEELSAAGPDIAVQDLRELDVEQLMRLPL